MDEKIDLLLKEFQEVTSVR